MATVNRLTKNYDQLLNSVTLKLLIVRCSIILYLPQAERAVCKFELGDEDIRCGMIEQ